MKRTTQTILGIVAITTCAAMTAVAHPKNEAHKNQQPAQQTLNQKSQQYSDQAYPVMNQQDIARGGQPSKVDMKQDTYVPVYKTQQDIANNTPAPTFEDGSSASVTNPAATNEQDAALFDSPEEGSSAAATGTTPAATTGTAAGATTAGDATATGEMNDGQIAQILKTANDAEIDAAQLAKRRAENDQVKEFAKTMIDDHKNNNKESKKVLKAADIDKEKKNEMAKTLKQDAKSKMDDMKKLKGKEFDRAYMESQVQMHTQLLADLDSKFIPAAKKPELKQFLQTTRGHVQHHLTRAQEIVKTLPAAQ